MYQKYFPSMMNTTYTLKCVPHSNYALLWLLMIGREVLPILIGFHSEGFLNPMRQSLFCRLLIENFNGVLVSLLLYHLSDVGQIGDNLQVPTTRLMSFNTNKNRLKLYLKRCIEAQDYYRNKHRYCTGKNQLEFLYIVLGIYFMYRF